MDIERVRADVALAMRDAVTANTVFSREKYTEAIVPAADYPKGWKANEPNWALVLKECESELYNRNGYFRTVTAAFVKKSLKQPLRTTNNQIARAIISRNPLS